MKLVKCSLALVLLLSIIALSACANKDTAEQMPPAEAPPAVEAAVPPPPPQPEQLPVRFQTPGYITAEQQAGEALEEELDEYQLKVGATIRSSAGPQPLWDILNRLAGLKGMSVSWASDVDQNVLVDVNIAAEDDFFTAIDNLLRQVDYFQEVEHNTIVVRYRETKKFYISIPYMKGTYTSTVGGNYLTDRDAASGTEGTVKITSDENEFDVWENVQANLQMIMQQWATVTNEPEAEEAEAAAEDEAAPTAQATRRMASGGSYYTVDRSVGLITVTAPRPLLEKMELYIDNLKKELYRQVVIEAKIIEVFLQDNSRIGLDWSQVLKNFSVGGTTFFGTSGSGGDGQVYPWIPAVGDADSVTTFVSKITLTPANFTVMLNALNEQGDANVLSNPKLTVLNGQPALISVGRDIAYIKTVSRNVDSGSGSTLTTVTYTAEVDNVVEGVALGVVASIVDDHKVILHLTPVTTDLIEDPIEYRTFGEGLEVGLPRVGIREMSTMVEVDNGEMLVIGGLIDEVERTEGSFAPIVGEIPVIKYLFGVEEKIKEKRELVILLTPKII
ncbi:pilus (MSHA type) biogenesis protein MshL [Desulfogranum mediterraneum]|uniref:pilus (MSHA type) biogenesis protein MshL n=1 Tax=Desulfogranum mediterraneum TaxID=160661 RepID=UPI0003FB29A8|nr:pilus (MSHA type) biogenesis protein MshL [Desulfogranum mediterraneum]